MHSLGSLHHLELDGLGQWDSATMRLRAPTDLFKSWQQCTRLSSLLALLLANISLHEALPSLLELWELPNLTSLTFGCSTFAANQDDVQAV